MFNKFENYFTLASNNIIDKKRVKLGNPGVCVCKNIYIKQKLG